MDSHAKDLENYVNVARNRRRRAKALLDFERHDDDELGFRKNDVITVSLGHGENCSGPGENCFLAHQIGISVLFTYVR